MRAAARLLPLLSLVLSGCAHAALQYGRDGLAPVDHRVRASLAAGRYGSAYEEALGADAALRDRLLRALSVGALGLYANRTDSSVWALERAWVLTEDRWSKRVSSGAAAAVVNDYVLPFTPGRTERLFIPFYGALSWLSRGDRDDAAVEARRLSMLLGEAADGGGDAVDGELRGLMHYVSGAIFEAAGERDAAAVSYRNAARLTTVPTSRDTAAADSTLGDVVVVVEQGFVGHPVPRDESIWVSRNEYTDLRLRDRDRADPVARRVAVREGMRGFGPGYYSPAMLGVELSLNWAEFREGRASSSATIFTSSAASQSVAGGGNVTRAVRADFERGQPARFARALLRAAARGALVDAAGDQLAKAGRDMRDGDLNRGSHPRTTTGAQVGKEGGVKPVGGKNVGTAGGTASPSDAKGEDSSHDMAIFGRTLLGLSMFALAAASQVNDVPDLRSWNLLPHDLRVVRLRLPAGSHDVRAIVDGQSVTLGRADVRAGQVTVMTYRNFAGAR